MEPTNTTLMNESDDASQTSRRLEELKLKQRSLRESYISQLSGIATGSHNISDEEDTERLSRSLSKIRVRRSSQAFKIDMNGMVEEVAFQTKQQDDERSVCSQLSMTSMQSASAKPKQIVGLFASGKTVLANESTAEDSEPTKEKSFVGLFATGKTVKAVYPSDEKSVADEKSVCSTSSKRTVGLFATGKTKLAVYPEDEADDDKSVRSTSSKRTVGLFATGKTKLAVYPEDEAADEKSVCTTSSKRTVGLFATGKTKLAVYPEDEAADQKSVCTTSSKRTVGLFATGKTKLAVYPEKEDSTENTQPSSDEEQDSLASNDVEPKAKPIVTLF